jgi:hypothetical protein
VAIDYRPPGPIRTKLYQSFLGSRFAGDRSIKIVKKSIVIEALWTTFTEPLGLSKLRAKIPQFGRHGL